MDSEKQMNCSSEMSKYLMNNNVAYRLRIPISVLIAIVVSVFMKKASSINNFLIAHVLIPIGVFLIIWFIIDVSVRNTISKDKLRELEDRCENVMNMNVNDDILNLRKEKNDMAKLLNSEWQQENMKSNTEIETEIKTETETEIETVHNVADYISTDKHHLKSINQEPIEKKKIKNTVSSIDEDKYGHENSNYLNGVRRYYSNVNKESNEDHESECLGGDDRCSPLCSGSGKNPCNLVAPIPGPQWQVQKAATVQNRMNHNVYTEASCPIR